MSLKIDDLGNRATYPYAFLTEEDIDNLSSQYSDLELHDLLKMQEDTPLIDLFN